MAVDRGERLTKGRRLPDGFHYKDSEPGDYWKQPRRSCSTDGERNVDWTWVIRDPWGSLGTLATHIVDEHDDGTITVSPSILDPDPPTQEQLREAGIAAITPGRKVGSKGWHGWLERGVWRDALRSAGREVLSDGS